MTFFLSCLSLSLFLFFPGVSLFRSVIPLTVLYTRGPTIMYYVLGIDIGNIALIMETKLEFDGAAKVPEIPINAGAAPRRIVINYRLYSLN